MDRTNISRRRFLTVGAAGAVGLRGGLRALLGAEQPPKPPLFSDGEYRRIDATERVYHVSCSTEMFERYGDLAELWRESGVTDAWLDAWFYGYFPYSWDAINDALKRIKSAGLRPHFTAVPFCHGGGALDPRTEGFPNLPPEHRKTAKRWDGSEQWGFSWHSPTDKEGAQAIQELYARYGVFDYFLDDDFRFASSPDLIGGCVCDECRADFLQKSGLNESRWEEVLADVRNSSDTPLMRAWVDYFCDRLTQCFRAYKSAVPEVDLGVMVMYMGCERAGIRLEDYKDALFRVGEGGFNDGWYDSVKTKTIELYSSLFHRRFCSPGRAFSETTIFPEGTLSAENMASKLAISTISDVRNTCFMSGLAPIPPEYWPTLAKRMASEREAHAKLLGAKPQGPFKHFYGVSARYCGGENAYSLFLALGVPFEVCDVLPSEGWTFMSDPDARAIERGALEQSGSKLIARFNSEANRFVKVDETLESLFEFRRSILLDLQLAKTPYVEEEIPVALAWYPDRNLAYVWNLEKKEIHFHLRRGDKLLAMKLDGLASQLVDLAAVG